MTESPDAPRPRDELTREIADGLRRIENNYAREGSGPGSRFEGRLLEDAQARWAVREIRVRAQAGEDFVTALDVLVCVLAETSSQERALLDSCPMCRNSLLYLLDRPRPASRELLARRMGSRLSALEIAHGGHHAGSPDSARPGLRGIL